MFKPVVGWEGVYAVSEQGEVVAVARTMVRSDGSTQTWSVRPLKSMISPSKGYLVVRLSRPGLRKMARVHRLVAEAFLPNPSNAPEVNHIDGNRANPNVSNLEWVSSSENRLHAVHVLRTVMPPRICKLSATDVAAIRAKYIPLIYGCKRLARDFGVNPSSIRAIVSGRSHTLPAPPIATEQQPTERNDA